MFHIYCITSQSNAFYLTLAVLCEAIIVLVAPVSPSVYVSVVKWYHGTTQSGKKVPGNLLSAQVIPLAEFP